MRTCTVHTVRFYAPEVRAIHCMARQKGSNKLALSRSDGTVEVWCIKSVPYLERVMYADSVESLAWSKSRLFSTGLHGTVLEFNLRELSVKHTVPLVGGPAWCLAADNHNTMLAAGTEEGYVNIMSVEGSELQPLKLLDKQEGRVLCLAWHPDGKQIITGSTDSLRLWDVGTGRAIRRMTVPRHTRNEETTVWFVAVTPAGQGVAGDSRGIVSFWDLDLGVQTQEVTTHKAPVLAVAMSDTRLFCSGADPFIAVLKQDVDNKTWFHIGSRRVHEHDVRALALFGETLVSGGVDGHVAFSQRPPYVMYKHPPIQHDAVALSKARLLLLRHTRHVELWALGTLQQDTDEKAEVASESSECRHLLTLESQHAEFMVCSAISADGAFLAYATPSTTRLVSLSTSRDAVSVNGSWSVPCGGAVVLAFCPATNRLAVANRGRLLTIYELDGQSQLSVRLEVHMKNVLKDTLRLLSFSPDGRYLVGCDLSGSVAAYLTCDGKLALKLCRVGQIATALCFREDSLLAVYADFKMCEWSLRDGVWTEFAGTSLFDQDGRTVVTRASWDPTRKGRLLLADNDSLYGLSDVDLDLEKSKKARRDGTEAKDKQVVLLGKYKNLAFADWLGPNELVVVETTPSSLERGLPAVLKKPWFGTK